MSEIKWAYDAQTNSFSALPASPWLLPALGLLCLAPIVERMLEESRKDPRPVNPKFDPILYAQYKQEYSNLTAKKFSPVGLTDAEELRMLSIMNPPWAEPGERWTY